MEHRGIVIRSHGKSFIVRTERQDIPCEIRGRLKFRTEAATPVAVGDDVLISVEENETGMIIEVLERRSMFFRPARDSDDKKQIIAANVDRLGIVVSVGRPPLKVGLIDRFLITARLGELEPVVIVNKVDLEYPRILDDIIAGYARINVPVLPVSALNGDGFERLEEALGDHRTILAGHSGVGKTTILNRLIPGLDRKVAEVSDYSNKGIHTTSWVELFELPRGGYIVDTPGLKILKLWQVQQSELDNFFPEMHPFLDECRFTGCSHTHEPDCAVKKAVEDGHIARFRYDGYVSIYESLEISR